MRYSSLIAKNHPIRCLAAAAVVFATTPFLAIAQPTDDPQATTVEPREEASTGSGGVQQSGARAEQLGTAVAEISRSESDGLVSARVSNARLGEIVAAAEKVLEIDIVLSSEALADEPAANVRFTDEPLGLAIRHLFEGFSHVSYVEPSAGLRIVKVYAVVDQDPAPPTATTAPVAKTSRVVEAGEPTSLEAFRSLKDLEEEAAALAAPGQPGLEPDELQEALGLEEAAEAQERLQEARTERALDALQSEHGNKVKADAVSDLVDSDDPRATDALIAVAEDDSQSPPLRQHAIETLVNRGAADRYSDPRLVEVLSGLSQDESMAVSSTASRLLSPVQRELAKPSQAE